MSHAINLIMKNYYLIVMKNKKQYISRHLDISTKMIFIEDGLMNNYENYFKTENQKLFSRCGHA